MDKPAPSPPKPRIYEADLEREATPDAHNANKGTERGQGMLEKSVSELGAGRSLLMDKHGRLIAGNKSHAALVAAGLTRAIIVETDGRMPVVVKRTDLDLSEKRGRARKLAYADNRTSEIGLDWDADVIARDLADGVDLSSLFSDKELRKLAESGGAGVAEDEPPPPPKTAVTQPGDVWELGRHRLACGDSLAAEPRAAALAGAVADLVWTDPPWNVSYGSGKDPAHFRKDGKVVANDALGEKFPEFLAGFASAAAAALQPGSAIYVAMSAQEWPAVDLALRQAGFHWCTTIIWAKDAFTLGRKDYHSQYEPIWYGWREGAPRRFPVVDRTQGDVWAFDRPRVSAEHPTMKPVGLVARAVANSSPRGGLVLDPFAGSGTTLVAAEQIGRRFAGVELDPRYADVIVERWQRFTGEKATRSGPGAAGKRKRA